ncbi:hypothetical protein MTR_2g065540 [Medicago truncatula]|uniref:Uncharacterized protein n=1 Tax=Medicago truncatula TaxID=3880 RepID=G7IQT8_MEDTR|nr:hypothetical protein MTR_2g065540 [Medicago truncatula]
MAANFSYWDDCVDPQDLEAMWNVPEVSAEWLKVGEERGRKVHLSRDPDGQPYLTQTEMRYFEIHYICDWMIFDFSTGTGQYCRLSFGRPRDEVVPKIYMIPICGPSSV